MARLFPEVAGDDLHWAYDPAQIRPLVPAELEVDTWDGLAWVSITPFRMVNFRLPGLPPVPGFSTFPESNVRTYVRGPDGRDGLWFLSLGYSEAVGRLSSIWTAVAAVFRPPPQKVSRSWVHCPICDEKLVGPYPAGAVIPGPAPV